MLQVYLFGVPAVHRNDEGSTLLPLSSQLVKLLACLLLSPRGMYPRSFLAGLFWPDVPEERARHNLSNALYRLRRVLEDDDPLLATTDLVGIRHDVEIWVDVARFEAALLAGDLAQATMLYRGDLLDGYYDEWLVTPRRILRSRALEAMERLALALEANGRLVAGLQVARRLALTEPLLEEGHRLVMRLLARLHRRSEALVHYEYLMALLDEELGVEPMPETVALAESLRDEIEPEEPALPPGKHTPFVGRLTERASALEILEAVIESGRGQVLVIEGPPGIGKSRLLCEVAAGALWRGAAIAGGNVEEQPISLPLSPMAVALNTALAGARAAQVETLLPPETLAALAPLYPPWRDPASLPELPPPQARDRFHQALADVWKVLGGLTPYLLFFEDIQWAAPALWDALDALIPVLPQSRLLLVLTCCRSGVRLGRQQTTLQRWEREGILTVLNLQPLEKGAVGQLLPAFAHDRLDEFMATTGGNPFLVTKALRAVDEGLPLAEALLPVWRATLSPAARTALNSAAVIGMKVPYHVWAAVTGMDPFALAAAADELADRQLLLPVPQGYVFSHNLLQEAVYEGMDASLRRDLHRRTAHALSEDPDVQLLTQAYHLDRAGQNEAAAALYNQVGAQKLSQFAFAEALDAFRRARDLLPPVPSLARLEALSAYAHACELLERHAAEEDALHTILREARALGEQNTVVATMHRLEALRGGEEQASSPASKGRGVLAGACRCEMVTLARADAPLGRPLTPDEKVTLCWTVEAPEDASVAGKVARRRYVLCRLLAEAEAVGAAPTDAELAAALGVCRHTILRDVAALGREGARFPTRRRRRVSPELCQG